MAAYATANEIKAAATGVFTDSTYDTLLLSLAGRASELIDKATMRDEGAYDAPATGTARWFDADGGKQLAIDECTAISAVTMRQGSGTTETPLATTDYITWPYKAPGNGEPIRRLDLDSRQGAHSSWPVGRQAVKVTAKWGYSDDPPEAIKQAVIIQALRWHRRGQQEFADTNLQTQMAGTLTYARALDPEVKEIIGMFLNRAARF